MTTPIMDQRVFGRPPSFNGAESDWTDWCFQMESFFGLMGHDDSLTEVVARTRTENRVIPSAEFGANHIGPSSFVFNVLVQVCKGKALSILKLSEKGNGYSAWTSLKIYYEPKVGGRQNALLLNVLNPVWPPIAEFEAAFLGWETRLCSTRSRAKRGSAIPSISPS